MSSFSAIPRNTRVADRTTRQTVHRSPAGSAFPKALASPGSAGTSSADRRPRAVSRRKFSRKIVFGAGAIAVLILASVAWNRIHLVSAGAAPVSSPTETVRAPFERTIVNQFKPVMAAPPGMCWIPGGEFSMGSNDPIKCLCGGHESMADARPVHRVYVDGFWMDQTDVTNEQFAKFVQATGYVTVAEITPTREQFPNVPPENLVAGSTVFTPTSGPVPLDDYTQWWRYVNGANWRHPLGPASDITGHEHYPVVQVAYADAVAYAKWAGKRLPTEAEWEFAARGGLAGKFYAWGDAFTPGGKRMANTYQGIFPAHDTGEDGFAGIAPVAQFPANGYGLYDMSGNVWQWCSDWYRPDYYQQLASAGVPRNPTGPESAFDPAEPTQQKRVQKGGSFLCTDQYCTRYMVGTRGKGETSTGSNHLGFRCVKDAVEK